MSDTMCNRDTSSQSLWFLVTPPPPVVTLASPILFPSCTVVCSDFRSEFSQIHLEKLQLESFSAGHNVTGPILRGERGGATARVKTAATF